MTEPFPFEQKCDRVDGYYHEGHEVNRANFLRIEKNIE